MKDEEIKLEKIEVSLTQGVDVTLLSDKLSSIGLAEWFGSEKNPWTCVDTRSRRLRMEWVLV